MAAKRRKPLSRGAKILFLLLGGLIFGGGLYLGVELGKPPPPPDLTRLTATPDPTAGESGQAVRAESGTGEEDATDDPSDAAAKDAAPSDDPPISIVRQPAPGTAAGVRVALVIDDMGRSVEQVEQISGLGVPITFAVLPYEVRTAAVVEALASRGSEYIVHLPMEALGGADPGPGALRSAMESAELLAATREALAKVPGAVGANNHMGSAVVTDLDAMRVVIAELGRHELYFLDSRTASETLGYSVARELGVPAAERQVFLDTTRDRAAIRGQFARLLAAAEERGAAIAIAHPYGETLEVLAEAIPEARARGIEFVAVSRLLDR